MSSFPGKVGQMRPVPVASRVHPFLPHRAPGLLEGHEESVQGDGGGGHRWKYERSVEGDGGQLSSADKY